MPERIEFHLDENVSNAIAEGLRRRGIDVTTTPEVGLMGVSDEAQIAFALAQQRIIFTQDWEWVEPEDMAGQVEFICPFCCWECDLRSCSVPSAQHP